MKRLVVYAIIAYVLFELLMTFVAAPRIVRVLTEILTPTPFPVSTYLTWTPPPTLPPLPCSRYVHREDCPHR